jgi:hypothetical protein
MRFLALGSRLFLFAVGFNVAWQHALRLEELCSEPKTMGT